MTQCGVAVHIPTSRCLGWTTASKRPCVTVRNTPLFNDQSCQSSAQLNSQAEDHPLSAVRVYLFDLSHLLSVPGGCLFHPQPEDVPCSGDRRPTNTEARTEELHNLRYSSTYLIRRVRWAEYVWRKGEVRSAYKMLVGKHERKRSVGDTGKDGKTILKWMSKKWGTWEWSDFSWLRMGLTGSFLWTQ